MNFLLDLLQSIGVAAGIGAGTPLAALVLGVLARGDSGIDFSGTDWDFLESTLFLAALIVGMTLMVWGLRLEAKGRGEPFAWQAKYALGPVVLGALFGAATMASEGRAAGVGIAAGALAAALGYFGIGSLLGRVKARLDAEAGAALPAYAQGSGAIAVVLCVVLPPLAVLIVAGLVLLLLGGRRREGERYAGLRILR